MSFFILADLQMKSFWKNRFSLCFIGRGPQHHVNDTRSLQSPSYRLTLSFNTATFTPPRELESNQIPLFTDDSSLSKLNHIIDSSDWLLLQQYWHGGVAQRTDQSFVTPPSGIIWSGPSFVYLDLFTRKQIFPNTI